MVRYPLNNKLTSNSAYFFQALKALEIAKTNSGDDSATGKGYIILGRGSGQQTLKLMKNRQNPLQNNNRKNIQQSKKYTGH